MAGMACARGARCFAFIETAGVSAADDGINQHWIDRVLEKLRPDEESAYINETDGTRRPGRLARCFSDAALVRLTDINLRYDPANVVVTPLDHCVSAVKEIRL
jgi:hypothetical protein